MRRFRAAHLRGLSKHSAAIYWLILLLLFFISIGFSTTVAAPTATRSYGGLKDQDRIFTNIYGEFDPMLAGALKRV
jgi:hypothetical protein